MSDSHNNEQTTSRWLSANQIRKQQGCSYKFVIQAMNSGELPFEQRGRVRKSRDIDVIEWEEKRLANQASKINRAPVQYNRPFRSIPHDWGMGAFYNG